MKPDCDLWKKCIVGSALVASILPWTGVAVSPAPAARAIPGITAPDPHPAGCVDCHVSYPDLGMDARISVLMNGGGRRDDSVFMARLQALAPEGVTFKGRHPRVDSAYENIPAACIECHSDPSVRAPSFGALMHVIHLGGVKDGHFLSVFQGECTHCHKLDMSVGTVEMPSGPEPPRTLPESAGYTDVAAPMPGLDGTGMPQETFYLILFPLCLILLVGAGVCLCFGAVAWCSGACPDEASGDGQGAMLAKTGKTAWSAMAGRAALVACALGGVLPLFAQNPESGALWLPYLINEEGALPTYGASVAVDGQGGIHAVYAIYTGTDQGRQPAIYAYCPAYPAMRTNWTFIRLGEAVQDARLALDPAGRPRLILFGPRPDPNTTFRVQYQYASCDAGWTNAANWTLTTVVTPIEATATREYDNNRYFAISPQGEAAFVYTDTSNNGHPGTFYMSCTAGHTNAANWIETTLTTDFIFDKPSLAFAPDGRPRLAFGLSYQDSLYLAYAQCDGASTNPASWSMTLLSEIHGSAMYSLQADTNGHPRLALSSGSYAAAPFADHQLYYLWCNEGATVSATNWSFNNVGLFLTSGAVDLALDTLGRPRISHLTAEGLGVAWCNTGAASANAVWQRRVVESNASLAGDYEVLPIVPCSSSSWINGQRSSLALDAAGNPRFGYDAQHLWTGVYLDPPGGTCHFTDITMTRFAFLNLPPQLAIRRLGNQLEISFDAGTLEFAAQPSGPWTPVAVNSPLLVTPLEPQGYYRVHQ